MPLVHEKIEIHKVPVLRFVTINVLKSNDCWDNTVEIQF
jgi:hypothetical protein